MRTATWLLAAALCVAPGCRHAVIFTTSNLTGVELNAVEGGMQTVRVGYDRTEGVLMPMRRDPVSGEYAEAYSVLAGSSIQSSGFLLASLGNVRVTQVFATGAAAQVPGAEETMKASVDALAGTLVAAEPLTQAESLLRAVRGTPGDDAQRARALEVVAAWQGAPVRSFADAQAAIQAAAQRGDSAALARLRSELIQAGIAVR